MSVCITSMCDKICISRYQGDIILIVVVALNCLKSISLSLFLFTFINDII